MASVKLEFSGGLELLLQEPKKPNVAISVTPGSTLRQLIVRLRNELIKERHELFATPQGDVRPGILVLINDTDWDLEGGPQYVVQDGDTVVFISTLHGG